MRHAILNIYLYENKIISSNGVLRNLMKFYSKNGL